MKKSMITFNEWLNKLRKYLNEYNYAGETNSYIFEGTAYQDYDLGLSPEMSAKIFVKEWIP